MNLFAKKSASTSLGRSLAFRVALGVAVAGAAVLGVASDASAQEVYIRPPAARVEVAPRAPSPHHFWVHGYWGYHPHYGYRWYGGRWEAPRAGWSYEAPHWGAYHGHYRFYDGRWHR
jgi:hypothetical protein